MDAHIIFKWAGKREFLDTDVQIDTNILFFPEQNTLHKIVRR